MGLEVEGWIYHPHLLQVLNNVKLVCGCKHICTYTIHTHQSTSTTVKAYPLLVTMYFKKVLCYLVLAME